MTAVLLTLSPVFLLIFLGWGVRRSEFVPESFWAAAEKVTYYIFFPALLVVNIAGADLMGLNVIGMMAALAAAICMVVGIMVLLRRPLRLDGPTFTSSIQGAMRPNTYISIAAIVAFFGDAGLTLAAACIMVVVPLVNLISVIFLVHYAAPERDYAGWRVAMLPVVKNPLIIACGIGGLLNLTGAGLPPLIGGPLDILGRAALPLGLLAVGAGLDFAAVRAVLRSVVVTSAVKLLVMPGLVFVAARAFGVEGVTAVVAALYMSVPASPSSYVLARQMNGDPTLVAGVIAFTTIAATVTMPIVLAVIS